MSGVHAVLGAFAGVAAGVLITVLRVWLVNRIDRSSPTPVAAVPSSAEVVEAERLAAGRLRSSFESTEPSA